MNILESTCCTYPVLALSVVAATLIASCSAGSAPAASESNPAPAVGGARGESRAENAAAGAPGTASGNAGSAPGSRANPEGSGAAPAFVGTGDAVGGAGSVSGNETPTSTGGGAGAGQNGTGTNCLQQGGGDYSKAGPYRVAREVVDLGADIAPNQGTGEYTIFYPQPFEAGCPHPIIAWGNGTGVVGPDVYAFFNENAASWGIVAIAAHDSNTGSGNYHRKGIDYLLAQNDNPDSKFFGKLSTRAGVSGHSQGGFGAATAASHPNVEALVPVGASGRALATTAFLCLTGTEDIAPDACRSAVQAAPGPAMAAIWDGGDHVVTETLAGFLAGDPGTIQMMQLYAAWFRCFLADDSVACGMFRGGQGCGICDDSGWAEVVTNNL